MKAILILGTVLAAGSAVACDVTVTLTNSSVVPMAAMARAKDVAAGIFAGIGVDLRWASRGQRDAGGCSTRIEVQLESSLGPDQRPGSLAYATVGAGADRRIHLFVDRVNAMVPISDRGALLGHVLAHEITHVLEGVARHSDAGVMKAAWERKDLRELTRRPLRFELVDRELIHAGLATPE